MATIVNNPSSGHTERVVERDGSGGGWAAALILLALLVVGGFVFFTYFRAPAPAAPANNGSTDINVTVPNPVNNSGGANNPAPAQ